MEKRSALFSIDQYKQVLSFLNIPSIVDPDYTYEIYSIAYEGIEELNSVNNLINLDTINSFELIQYVVGEYLYSVVHRTSEDLELFKKNDNIKTSMASVVADKYLSLSAFHHPQKSFANKFIPPISSLSTYINFMLNILQQFDKNDPKTTLISDLLTKSLSIARCTLDLLVDGFETEAFSSWRTLHECECTLVILEKYGDPIIDLYNKHMSYGIVFKDIMKDKEKQTEIFNSMKEEMKQYNLKSKDIKKYIEYGWLYGIEGVKDDESFKLNFRDGLQKLAGLSKYSNRYEMSSEIIHSTPMLIYSNKQYFYYVTLLSLYESFFRLEYVFTSLFSKRVTENQMAKYLDMRKIYYSQLVNIHEREANSFKAWQASKKRD